MKLLDYILKLHGLCQHGAVHQWIVYHKWMVYFLKYPSINGISIYKCMGYFGDPHDLGNLQVEFEQKQQHLGTCEQLEAGRPFISTP